MASVTTASEYKAVFDAAAQAKADIAVAAMKAASQEQRDAIDLAASVEPLTCDYLDPQTKKIVKLAGVNKDGSVVFFPSSLAMDAAQAKTLAQWIIVTFT